MLVEEAEDLWTVDHELRLPMRIPYPTRMTVVRVSDGSLVLISPVPIDDALAQELAALGPVSHLLAPNLLHHLHLAAAQKRYPEARVQGASGLAKKEPDLRIEPLDIERFAALRSTLAAESIEGVPKISETVLFHRPSRTLVVTDLLFNIETPPSWTTSVLLSMTGTRGRLAQSRVWSLLLEHRALARASCERLLEWDFDRLIVAHGNVVRSGAKTRVASALTRTGTSSC
jgi:hypothetical protein